MCSHTSHVVNASVCLCECETRGEETWRQTVAGKAQGPLQHSLKSKNCYLLLKSWGESNILRRDHVAKLCWFGVQAFNQLHLFCQGCKKERAVQFHALYFVCVKPALTFVFCGESN